MDANVCVLIHERNGAITAASCHSLSLEPRCYLGFNNSGRLSCPATLTLSGRCFLKYVFNVPLRHRDRGLPFRLSLTRLRVQKNRISRFAITAFVKTLSLEERTFTYQLHRRRIFKFVIVGFDRFIVRPGSQRMTLIVSFFFFFFF